MDTGLEERLHQVQQELRECAGERAVQLIAVSKTRTPEEINPLFEMGQTALGENRVQEILEKKPFLNPKFQIHLIGQLQTNKVKYIIDKVCMIHSVDREDLLREIEKQAARHNLVMPVLIEVNIGREKQKGGVMEEQLEQLLMSASACPHVQVRGLMTVLPKTEDIPLRLSLFTRMQALQAQIKAKAIPHILMDELSMGMSGDFHEAARCGATMVRIGSRLFGPRAYPVQEQSGGLNA